MSMAEEPHRCPGALPREVTRLTGLLLSEPWFTRALDAVTESGLPDAWIGAGAIRDVVWGQLFGRFSPDSVKDIDVAYFDSAHLGPERDQAAQHVLGKLAPLPWEATNQAAVHTWYQRHFGGPPVEPFSSVHDAIATWPETATCVGVRRKRGAVGTGALEICAPHGLADLLGGVWRVNPVRVTPEISRARLARQRVQERWPGVTVVPSA
jgi:uncharacterized protein